MNQQPKPNDDDAWLRGALRADLQHGDYLDDGGFSARVVQRLPAPRLPWLDGLSVALVLGLLALGLWPLLDVAAPTFVHAFAGQVVDPARDAVAIAGAQLMPLFGHLSLNSVLTVFAPLLALAAAAFVLAEI